LQSGISALQHLTNNFYAVGRFHQGMHYVNLFTPVGYNNPTGLAEDFGGNVVDELRPDAVVQMIPHRISQRNVLLLLSETIDGRIVLMLFDKSTQQLLGKKYLGDVDPYHLGAAVVTMDNGLAVLCRDIISSSFSRLVLLKFSEEDLEAEIQN
jgi:hypothetical protein